jgi:PRD1 phage membrane DNA delivery
VENKAITGIVGVLLAIIGLAIIAALVSPNAQTGNVLTSGAQAIANAIRCALSPVTGGSCGSSIPSVSSTITFGNTGTGGGGPV